MEGPEQLEIGPPSRPRRTRWLVLGAVVLVLAGLGVSRVAGLGSVPAPAPTQPPTGPTSEPATSQPWPASGLPAGTLYVLADAGLYTVDAGSGELTKSHLTLDASDTVLTPMAGGVLLWTESGHRRPRLLAYGSRDAHDLGGAVRAATTFLPGPGDAVWSAAIDRREPARRSTWRLVDEDGRAAATTEVRGFAVGDGAGGLFGVDSNALRHVYPDPPQRWSGDLLATGPDGFELFGCVRGRCSTELHDRSTGTTTTIGTTSASEDLGVLSPGNRFIATVDQGPDDGDVIRVAVPGSEKVRRSFPSGSYATTFAWLSDRWLVATSEEGLVLYDAEDDVLLHPVLPVDAMSELVWQPS